jgi:hypothetical protein
MPIREHACVLGEDFHFSQMLVNLGLARATYVWCMYGTFGR